MSTNKIIKSTDAKVKEIYRDGLDTITKARYLDKLKGIGDKDPYEMQKSEFSADMAHWPEVTYPDIVNYLVYTQSAYTLNELKAYKSLQGYNYFISGFVQDIGHTCINGKSVFLGKVKHSQRMSDPSLRPWLIVEQDGSVTSAHCTCMAGIGEVCSHVGALLFAIEAAVKIRNSQTVTETKAYWMLPSAVNKVEYKSVQDIDFTSAKTKKRKLDQAIAEDSPVTSGPKQRKLPTVKEPSTQDLNNFFSSLSRTGTRPVILSLVPQFAHMYRPKVLDRKYPTVLSELYTENCGSLQSNELLKQCEEVFHTIKVTEEEAKNCELATRDQAKAKQWFNFRIGRITASRVKRVCRTALDKPSKSLIKDICYPISKTFTSKATTWGCDHEKDAKVDYINTMSKNHINFQWHDSGLLINPKYPFMGASPDGRVSCDCCGDILVEIKCPYCQRTAEISDEVDCLKITDGSLHLDKGHAYFYQIQCQLMVAEVQSCDFVVWTEADFYKERITIDNIFCIDMVERSSLFFKKAILPELIGKLYSRPLQEATPLTTGTPNQQRSPLQEATTLTTGTSNQQSLSSTTSDDGLIICTCQTPYNEEVDDVIGCDNENCPFVWFHFKCAKIKRIPKGKWFCKECRKK
ncbi:unnamed protein product [Mytilus coruscus]|uniref:SWIM-type domain-containing protein n=1 Tax=Mytilus coruscus TaxID=42192 RepID=A0A6J8D810_MYTCO|nr:unnamed protein product [Mytilus coruscus]